MAKKEYIRISNWPPDHAQEAYEKGYYVEAIQVLHGWIECQARGLLMLVGSIHFNTNLDETWDQVDQMAYKDVVRALLVVGQVSQQEAHDLIHINSTRNKIIHQIFRDPHDKRHLGMPRSEYDQIFRRAIRWANIMHEKREAVGEDSHN